MNPEMLPLMLSSAGIARDARCDLRAYLQPAFVICVVVLALGGAVMSKFDIEQEPWPLKKPLTLLEQENLGPYVIASKQEIDNEDILKNLGTEDYIQWALDDTETPFDSPTRKVMLFITYYALADRVPHVPEECYVGAGHQLLASDEMKFTIESLGGEQQAPGRVLVFQKTSSNFWSGGEKFSAFYLFSVNGIYANSRESARFALNRNMFSRHSYFSKVEWSFYAASGAKSYLDREEAKKAGEKLLTVILPILETKYWPTEEQAAGEEPSQGGLEHVTVGGTF